MIRGVGSKNLLIALYGRLTTHVLTSGYNIMNKVPRLLDGVTFPYVTFHSPTVTVASSYSARDQEAEDIAVDIHIWSERNSDEEAATMMDNITRAIGSSPLSISSYNYIYSYLDLAEILIDDTESAKPIRHGIVRFRFFIVPTS